MLPYNAKLKERARELRDNMTNAERFLWAQIRAKQVKDCWFYRQKPIGIYIADFYCPKARLVIEVDGGHHFSDETIKYDRERDAYINSLGLTVLRFTNDEVLRNIEGVVEVIENKIIEQNPPCIPPLRKGEKIILPPVPPRIKYGAGSYKGGMERYLNQNRYDLTNHPLPFVRGE